jgi:glutaredoxin 3
LNSLAQLASVPADSPPPTMAAAFINEVISSHKVAVFSKTFCPYCDKAKRALASVRADAFVVELDNRPDAAAIQAELG